MVDFNIMFTFVYTGWEGSTNDAPVFMDKVTRKNMDFPRPADDKY